MKKLIGEEIKADAEKFGDARRSPLKEREAAQAIDETALIPTEPVTVVLSKMGWVRAAKGHDIDPRSLSYKAGDEFLQVAMGRSNQQAVFLDTTGRSYTLPAHTLPSARGQGEPLTGRLTPPPGANFTGVLIGTGGEERCVVASAAGYGFVCKFEEMLSRNKSGKSTLSVPKGSGVLPPLQVPVGPNPHIVVVTAEGRMLLFPITELPELSRGKGNKIIQLKAPDQITAWCILSEGSSLKLLSGQRHMSVKWSDVEHYRGTRSQRGHVLPRGFRQVQQIEAGEG